MRRAASLAFALLVSSVAAPAIAAGPQCRGTIYLTFDTGSMSQAKYIADTLRKYSVKATFFLADEKTVNGDTTLSPGWAEYWRGLVADGHAFGDHTWHHWYFRGDTRDGRVVYSSYDGKQKTALDRKAFCAEFERVNAAFRAMTGRPLDPIWRAPGGQAVSGPLK